MIRLEILLILAQDRCPVCAECTMGKEIDLGHPMVDLGNVCQVEACFGPFRDTISPGAR